ncbi:MAG: hypothetical protein ACI9J4_000775 [Paraglaciecola sp.]|jgi:hypothetical protein
MGINLLFLRAAKRSFSFVAQYLLGKGKGKGKSKSYNRLMVLEVWY